MKHSVPRRWDSLTFSAFIGRSGSREVAEDKGRVIRGMPQAHTMRCWRISGCRYVMMANIACCHLMMVYRVGLSAYQMR